MSNFKVFPIPDSVVSNIREKRFDDFGHQLSVSIATENDTGPCRSCLTVFRPGEGRLLFSYAPNQCDHPYNEVGPIYIHENECRAYAKFQEFPSELRTRRPLVLRCYADNGEMVGGELVGERPVEDVIKTLFSDPDVSYLHARTATVGCYIARIERAESCANGAEDLSIAGR
jgi:Protein of unknown function (DUF1203)